MLFAFDIRLADIKVGKRHRKDMGDTDALAENIEQRGLLHPIIVTAKNQLVAGERRLLAFQSLGRRSIPAHVVDIDKIVLGEYAENTFRKDWTLSEAVAVKRAVEPAEKAAAKARMLAGKPLGNLPKGRAADNVAKLTGKKRRTLAKAEAVVAAAEAEPERFGKLLADMDRTGHANGAFRLLKIARQAAAIRAEPRPLPGNGPYRVIAADVPWPYAVRDQDMSKRGLRPYPSMSMDDICALAGC